MVKQEKYQISKNRYILIEITTPEESKIIKILNNEFDKEKKKEKTYRKKTISLNMLQEKYSYEFANIDFNPDKDYVIKERNEIIMSSINTLSKRQKQIIFEHFFNYKSLRKIALENNLSSTSVREYYYSALKKLKKKLIIFKE